MKINSFKYKALSLLLFIIATFVVSFSQDLRTIKVDQLSDDQIKQLIKKTEASGMSQQEMESVALAKGLAPSEIQKLKERIQNLNLKQDISNADININRTRNINKEENPIDGLAPQKDMMEEAFSVLAEKKTTGDVLEKQQFGYYLFNSKNLTFEPSINLPTPQNYQLGPGDEIIIDIWGASQQSYKQTIAPEGYIFIENIGPIYINGLTIEKASKQIIGRLSNIYSGLLGKSPNTFAQVNLGNLRSIKVNLVGEVRTPGTYTLPSLSTVFNALYASGGPNSNGSFRDIFVYRENKLVITVDVYDFLLKGDQKSNIRLQDQDVIMVKPHKIKVDLNGEVKHPAYFEMRENETLKDLFDFAGGFTDKAYKHRVKIVRMTDKEQKVADVTKEQFVTFALENGDIITVEPILNRYENRVEINGAVYRPGQYELIKGLTIKKLIEQAEGIRGDAFTSRAIIYRMREDFTIEAIPFDLQKLINGQAEDIALVKEDLVKIYSLFDLQEKYNIQVEGEVSSPGIYPFVEKLTLSDIIATAGGFKESASLARIDVARRIKNTMALTSSDSIAKIYRFSVSKELLLDDSASKFLLEPFDRIFIRRSPGYEVQSLVTIHGEVNFPGSFSILHKTERISDIIKRAGDLTKEAYAKGARLTRKLPVNEKERRKILKAIQSESNDSIKFQVDNETEQSIGIDLERIMKNPNSKYDLILQEGDVLVIPKQLQTVRLSGAFLYPITVRYEKGQSLRKYAAMAGGFSEDAKSSKVFVIYANGAVDRTSSFLGIKNYPDIEPGAEIVVPKKIEGKKMTPQELLGVSTAMTSLALIIVTIVSKI